ncbi:EAL domain-containing protein [Halomonas sp. 18H]|nr:GGDEF domain-containing phosphodiesterase [Halomonas sp. 18H]MCW4151134.1 EAL domain-containing protein [Halomonas sp. 18H]
MASLFARLGRWLARLAGQGHSCKGQNRAVSVGFDGVELVRQQYQESEERFRRLLESLPRVAVQGYDRQRRVIYWNQASTTLYGYSAAEAMGQPLEDLIIPAEMRDDLIASHRAWMEHGRSIPPSELELVHLSGERVPVFSHHVMLGEHTDSPVMFCVDVDLSDQKRAHRDLDFATRFDALTCLPNRQALEGLLNEALETCLVRKVGLAVLYLDIDRFSEINDALGYEQGDQLLSQLARRLRGELRLTDLISRVSSDEFVLVFLDTGQCGEVYHLVSKVQYAMRQPFMINGVERSITASLGVSIFPEHGNGARELIRNANVAKNRAKLDGLGGLQFFQRHHHDELVHQQRLVEKLEQAIERQELELYFQPQVSVASQRVENLEALLRWKPHDSDVFVPPDEFIPLAERSGLIHPLGEWVMEEACRQQAAWRAAGFRETRVDINLSGRQLLRANTLTRFEACLERHGLAPQDVGIELTENVLIDAASRVLEDLRRLYHRGVRIAIDDFGTGYSSLSYLKHFPVTSLKIDRTFMQDSPIRPADRSILEAAIFMGHRMGLEVVAEGVEYQDQWRLIGQLHCDLAQGYYFHRPMSAADIPPLLERHTNRRVAAS